MLLGCVGGLVVARKSMSAADAGVMVEGGYPVYTRFTQLL